MPATDQRHLIADLMQDSGVGFGTSGARGLAAAMSDRVCYAYTQAFLLHLEASGQIGPRGPVGLAGDYRPSSPRILRACARAVADLGREPRYFGHVPTPALVNLGLREAMPTLMVTGSHIPDDRNGIKFHTPTGEILKQDETAIRAQWVSLPSRLFDPSGSLRERLDLPPADPAAFDAYVQRYLDFLPADSLAGCRLGLYQHSSVAREVFAVILTGLGAEVVRLGFSSTFIPVDTEAIRPEDQALAAGWAAQGHYTALVSADGDGDRPLVADEQGRWLRGDITGILTAHFLAAATVVTPVSSNTALERSGWFPRVVRTRIGSPYVIAAMQEALAAGATPVVGYEANGGFLTGSDLLHAGRRLPALPTRDAMLVALSLLVLAREQGCPISELSAELPQRFTCSDRLKAFPPELARARIAALTNDPAAIAATFGSWLGPLADRDSTDGLRMHFANGEIVHLRPSGNAPELRVYTEAAEPERATQLNQRCLRLLEGWRGA